MIYNENPIAREAIDKLLKKNAKIQSNLGVDSTELERFQAKIDWADLLRKIRSIDPEFADVVQPQ